MAIKEFGEYYLGLDIGTDSIGWAVTDLNYNLYKLNGKSLWGVRIFDKAQSALQRRTFRTTRRRLQRRNQRILLLQELFFDEIYKIDPELFLRLKESKYHIEDRTVKQPNILFCSRNYSDKQFHQEYPTIYHLRKKLIETDKKVDIRLIYLAIHHILKYRGHFLFEGNNLDAVQSITPILYSLSNELKDEYDLDFACVSVENVEEVLKDKYLGVRDKQIKLQEEFNITKDQKQAKAIVKALSGASVKLSELFEDKSLDDIELSSISFKTTSYEEITKLEEVLNEHFYILEKLKSIYDWGILADILNGQFYLSFAKVDIYEKHGKDLRILKNVIAKYRKDSYKKVFSDTHEKNNYCAYIGMTKRNNKKQVIENKKCSQLDFCKYIFRLLENIEADDDELRYVKEQTQPAVAVFMPKIVSKNNGVIPYQLHYAELTKILENASKHYPFFNVADKNGITVKDKILQIMKFRIPYYVGPLNDKDINNKNCWVVRRSREKIYPWNFDSVVDKEASAENFITRMTSQCTYLRGADVLPKSSLLYSQFTVLNELNNLRIEGEKISVELKQKLYHSLFENGQKVTAKKLRNYLKVEGVITGQEEISGVDGDFKSTLASKRDFDQIFAGNQKNSEIMENVIRWIVIFGQDKAILRKKIMTNYGDDLTKDQINRILTKKYSGWGQLSRAFLKEIYSSDPETGEAINIITAMWETNNNLMQLLSKDFNYWNQIEAYNAKQGICNELSYQAVENLYVSPAVKRQIWQSLVIVKELKKIMQRQPKRVFIEMARASGKKIRTTSRKDSLLYLYKNCKDVNREWTREIASIEESSFRSDKLYLYYTQMGRCMYTSEIIDLEDLFNVNMYDVDHIYPQSKVKDDSINNRVLVKKIANADKSDVYPLPAQIRNTMRPFWEMLRHKELITKDKFERLIRQTGFTDRELSSFISRQLVETRQSTKAVASILKAVFNESEIVYVKANTVSEFRDRFNMIKVRDVNDLHHAKDALLNIVVGNVNHTKFTRDPMNFIKEHNKYNLRRLYDFDVRRGGVIAWISGENGTIADVHKTIRKNNILFTRYSYENKGQLFDVQIMKKGKGQLPVKSSDTRMTIDKYGGYNKINGAYFMLVEHALKDMRARSLIEVPLHLKTMIEKDKERGLSLCREKGLQDPVILLAKIKIKSLLQVDGFKMHITGRTGSSQERAECSLVFSGAHQLCISDEMALYIKAIMKYLNRAEKYNKTHKNEELYITEYDKLDKQNNLRLYDLFVDKLQNTVYHIKLGKQGDNLAAVRKRFEELSIENQCTVLNEILQLFRCNRVLSDFKAIGIGKGKGKSAGTISITNKISNYKEVKLINQSPTGIFEQEIDLLKL